MGDEDRWMGCLQRSCRAWGWGRRKMGECEVNSWKGEREGGGEIREVNEMSEGEEERRDGD